MVLPTEGMKCLLLMRLRATPTLSITLNSPDREKSTRTKLFSNFTRVKAEEDTNATRIIGTRLQDNYETPVFDLKILDRKVLL